MTSFSSRRWRNVGILAILSGVLVLGGFISTATLHRTPALSGWLLMALVVGLALYNVRKKFPHVWLGSSATWLQLHIYTGMLTTVVFGLHVRWRVPHGALETILAGWYVAVVTSGVLGLALSRAFARRLTTRGQEVLFERIPRIRGRIRSHVERLVLECLATTESAAIADFYAARLSTFFEAPRNFWSHLLLSHRSRRALLREIDSHRRFLSDQERTFIEKIAEQVRAKDDLDFQYAHQATLKYWMFVHVPLTYGLLVTAAFHVLLVYAFSGGIR